MSELRLNRDISFEEKPPFPKNMMMELTNVCNHQCVFCGYGKMNRPKGKCDKPFMFDIMRQAYENGTREIGFYMIGEPLLCADLEEYVAEAKRLGFEYIYITTNGVLADLERMKELIKAGLSSIKFSLNAGTRETYKKIHGKDDYETVKSNILGLSQYIRENNIDIPIFISFVRTKINKNEEEELRREFADSVDKIYVFPCGNQGGGMLELVDRGVVEGDEFVAGANKPCDMIFNRIHVTYQGYLDVCCVDTNNMLATVDLHKMSLKDAWNSEIMVKVRKWHLSELPNNIACYNCIYSTNTEILPLNAELKNEGEGCN